MTKDIATLLLALLLCHALLLVHLLTVRGTVLGRRPEIRLLLAMLAICVGDLLLMWRQQLSGPLWLLLSNTSIALGAVLLSAAARCLLTGRSFSRCDLLLLLGGAIGLALLLVQAISEIIKRAAIMQGLLPDPNADAMSAHELAELEAVKLAQAITTDKP